MRPEPELPRGWPGSFGAGAGEREALLRLSHVTFAGPRRLRELAWDAGSARACLRRVRAGAMGPAAAGIVEAVAPGDVERALRACGAEIVTPGHERYPSSLLDLSDPPPQLFWRGGLETPMWPSAAVVGARNCSPYGRELAESIARGLASAGVTIVSGAARGIDGAAHRGALEGGGATVAVLGSGIDVPYPTSHAGLLDRIERTGAILSEYPPGIRPDRYHFPARNRIVVGLSRTVVVVEGAPGSGSMISVEFAQQIGRDVLAVPGPVTSPLSDVPNQLIREGATLIRGSTDAAEALLGPGGLPSAPMGAEVAGAARRVLEGVKGAPVTAEAVAAASGVPLVEALSALAALELGGLIRQRGGRYERTAAAREVGHSNPKRAPDVLAGS